MVKPITKILIANRGEIAVRIIRTCKQLGIATVAVYSDADQNSPHRKMADTSMHIGASPSRLSYLNQQVIIEAALKSGADAIHPGYGFLSENSQFAAAVTKAGLIFIGPSAHSILMMGNKLAAKQAAKEFSIPMVPGTDYPIADAHEARNIASQIGFPLLVKAAAGGGGKGMRIVHASEDLEAQIERAISEAQSSFGDGSVFIEKYISSPRHIEIQVIADQHGNCIHLFERECSIQRRHQKIIEEAPSSVLNQQQRDAMGSDAIRVARACDYSGAGTVEFLLDENGNHYFLEMNTRLQVEHPVTEMITGLDLVEMQIRIAEGNALTIQQEDLKMTGHAIELRVYAEDPTEGFVPSTGKLMHYKLPQGKGIRVDDGYAQGLEIPIHYDPMLSKLVVHADSRSEAINLLAKAIETYEVRGVQTTLDFGKFAVTHPAFVSGQFDTHFIEKFMHEFMQEIETTNLLAAKIVAALYQKNKGTLVLPVIEPR